MKGAPKKKGGTEVKSIIPKEKVWLLIKMGLQ